MNGWMAGWKDGQRHNKTIVHDVQSHDFWTSTSVTEAWFDDFPPQNHTSNTCLQKIGHTGRDLQIPFQPHLVWPMQRKMWLERGISRSLLSYSIPILKYLEGLTRLNTPRVNRNSAFSWTIPVCTKSKRVSISEAQSQSMDGKFKQPLSQLFWLYNAM